MTDETTELQSLSFREYGANVIGESLEKMLGVADDVRKGDDIEAIHDMRVASRRLRAAIDVFGPAFRSKEFDRFDREVKRVTRELGAARDLDVMIQTLAKLELTLAPAEQAGVESFLAEKRGEREAMQPHVLRALDRMESRDLPARFRRLVEKSAPRTRDNPTEASERDNIVGVSAPAVTAE